MSGPFFITMKTLPSTFQLVSERCRYRQPTEADIEHTFTASRYPGFNDGMTWDPPATPQELLPNLQNTIATWNQGSAFSFIIEDKETSEFIGRVSIRHAHEATWDLGFWTHPEKQNRGYMTEAVARMIAFGFEELAAEQIIARHACWNKASEAVMKKNGMTFIRHIPQGFQKGGEWVEENELGITRESWLANKAK